MVRRDISLREKEVVFIFCKYVRHHQTVEHNLDFCCQARNIKVGDLVVFGFDILPESMKRIEKPAQWRHRLIVDHPAIIQEVDQRQRNSQAEQKFENAHPSGIGVELSGSCQ